MNINNFALAKFEWSRLFRSALLFLVLGLGLNASLNAATNLLNLEVYNQSGQDPCGGGTQVFRVGWRITNWDTVAVDSATLSIRFYFNSGGNYSLNGCWNTAYYTAGGSSLGAVGKSSTHTSTGSCSFGGKSTNQYIDVTFGSVSIPANGGYMEMLDYCEFYRGWAFPFDDSCDDYSTTTAGSRTNEADFVLRQSGSIVCEYTNASTQDPNSGVDPCTGSSACSGGGPTNTPTHTPTATFTPTPVAIGSCASPIQAEDFTNASDSDAGNNGGQYRNAPAAGNFVDIETTSDAGGGYNVGWTNTGEWLEYVISVPSTGNYNFTIRSASGNGTGGTIQLAQDGSNVGGNLVLPGTGGWQTWVSTAHNNIPLTAGTHTLRLTWVNGGSNFNWLCAVNAAPPTDTPTATLTPTPGASVCSICTTYQEVASWTCASCSFAFNAPESLEYDRLNNQIVVAGGVNNDKIAIFDTNGNFVRDWGCSGGGAGCLNSISAVTVDASGNIYTVDRGSDRVYKFDQLGNLLASFVSSSTNNCGGAAGNLYLPRDIAWSPLGYIYVIDDTCDQVTYYSDSTLAHVGTWGSSGTGNGQFVDPRGIDVDAAGNVYVLDMGAGRDDVQVFNSTGTYLHEFMSSGTGAGQTNAAWGLAVDGCGDVFVTDEATNQDIIQIWNAGSPPTINQEFGSSGTGALQFGQARGITYNHSDGTLFTVDFANNKVQKFGCVGTPTPTATPTTATCGTTPTCSTSWTVIGNGYALSNGVHMTDDVLYQSTAAWSNFKLDLTQSWTANYQMYFGTKDATGADGIVFVMHNDARGFAAIGDDQRGLGYGYVDGSPAPISPSVAVEFDTFQNTEPGPPAYSDPAYDHTAIHLFGSANTPAFGPVGAAAGNANIEDGNWHNVTISWNAGTTTLTVIFDGSTRMTYSNDLINNVFGGQTCVFWGFTAGTGGESNQQEVRELACGTPTPTSTPPPSVQTAACGVPTVDGALSDGVWAGGGWFELTKTTFGSPNLLAARFKTSWDATYLYVAVDVDDMTPYQDSANRWDDDTVEIYIDMNNAGSGSYQADDDQLLMRYNLAGGLQATNGHSAGVTVQRQNKAGSVGYTMEWAIPWATWSVTPSNGQTIGFDIGVDNDTNGGDREGSIVWAGDGNNFTSTANFGDVVLAACANTFTRTVTRTITTGPSATFTRTATPTFTRTVSATRTPVPSATSTATPRMALTKTTSTGTAVLGDTITFCLYYYNDASASRTIHIWDSISTYLTYVGCNTSCSQSGGLVSWTIANVPSYTGGNVCFWGTVNGYPYMPELLQPTVFGLRQEDLEMLYGYFPSTVNP